VVARRVGVKTCRVHDRELRGKVVGDVVGDDEEIAREQTVPRRLGDDADREPIAWIGADVRVEREDLTLRQIGGDAVEERVEVRGLEGLIRVVPVDCSLTLGLANEELVLRGTTGVRSRIDDDLAVGTDGGFAARNRVLDQLRNRKVLPEL